jgi:3-oxoacyl-[acyl-carrier-protein] synthase-3
MKVKILATGSYAPDKVLDNAYFEKIVETSDAWILERSGIRQRRAAAPGQATSDLAAEAARRALRAADVRPEEVDTLIVATSSPDRVVPPTAVYVQAKLGCWNAGCSDLIAACSGFTYALAAGRAYVAAGQSRRCLVIGAEELTRITNYKDRSTCVLFGDAAGAVVLAPSDGDSDILYSKMGCDGRLEHLIVVPAGGTALQPTPELLEQGQQFIQMKGREVYKFAVPKFVEIIQEALDACDLRISDIKAFIPHQMNARMIEAVAERLAFPADRLVMNIDRYGNTSAASIPLALDEIVRDGRLRRGDLLLLSAMGAGITWGTVILRW